MSGNFYKIESCYTERIKHKYTGEYNDDQERTGSGCQEWDGTHNQKYTGTFLHNNLHGKGRYVDVNKCKSYMYEGTFYANNFEGYSNITYLNGDYFEGLFRNNNKFGPGIYTHADGTQNVGLWYGNQLIRLSSVILEEWVPKLARSSIAKTKLLKYRKLVPIKQEYEDIAKDILVKLNARPEVIANSDKLYNSSIRNVNSLFFNKKAYDMAFFGEMDCTIDVAVDNYDSGEKVPDSLIKSTQEIPRDIIRDILDYLLENVDIVETLPIDQRRQYTYETILSTRHQFQKELDTTEVKAILDDFMNKLDDLLSKSKEERKLMVNKKTIRKKLPKCDKVKTDYAVKKVAVTDLLAWNNEEISMEMMLHVFAHRNKEDSVSFSIARVLTGDRLCFNIPGEIEKNCILFLNLCSAGNANSTIKIIKDNCLNPDICDAKGNSGIIFASSRDKWNIIKLLCDVGANLDQVNDEGMTALGICILRYIALQQDIKDWERAFLPDALVTPAEEMQVRQWHPHASLTNISLLTSLSARESVVGERDSDLGFLSSYHNVETVFKSMAVEDDGASTNSEIYEELKNLKINMLFKTFQEPYIENFDVKQRYILNVKCTQGMVVKSFTKPKLNKLGEKESYTSRRSRSSRCRSRRDDVDANFVKDNKLKVVFTTIKVLLGCGADPNLTRVPLPVLLLAVFCDDLDLFQLILTANADPNITSEGEGVTALHLIAALPFTADNLNMFHFLLKMGADPNLRTNVYHWVEEKEKLLGKRDPEENDLGKTALHILSMRYDFLNNQYIHQKMVEHLIDHKAQIDDVYLGHVPLSLAILRGNLGLIRFYLDSGKVNPYKVLGEKMGVATTVLILKRYSKVLSFDRCTNVYDLLMEKNVNPLVEFQEYGNAIEFMAAEYGEGSTGSPESQKFKNKKKKFQSKSKLSKFKLSSSVSSKKKKPSSTDDVKNYLLECTRRMLQRHIQYAAYKYLKRFIIQDVDLENPLVVTMVNFLPVKDLVNLMQLLIRKGVIQPTPKNFYLMLTMLESSKKHHVNTMKKTKAADISSLASPLIIKVLNWIEKDYQPIVSFNMIEPELDALTDKYKVCFYCCKRTNKDLIVCPNCGLVYFCSEECNKLSNKHASIHKCNIVFYNHERTLRAEALANGLEYNSKSKLDGMLDYLDEILRQQYGTDFSMLGISSGDVDFDKLGSFIFDKLLESDPTFLEKVERSLRDSNLSNFEEIIQNAEERKMKGLDDKSYGSDYKMGSELFNHITRRRSKDRSMKDIMEKKGGKGIVERGKFNKKEKSSKKGDKLSRKGKKGESKKSKESVKSSDKSSKSPRSSKSPKSPKSSKAKHGKDRSKGSKKSKRETLETVFRRDKSKGKYSRGDKSSKYAVYKHHIQKSDYTRSRKDKYEQEQSRLRGKYKEQQGAFGGLWGDMGKLGYRTAFDELGRICGKLPNKCQFFLEKLSELFPDIDFSVLFWPYVCYVDGQLYYRFLEERPIFIETYSNV